MKIVTHLKTNKKYLFLFKITNATNNVDGQVMALYIGKYKGRFRFFVREFNEFETKFK